MRGYHEELCTRLRTIEMMITSGVKIKKKIICNAMHEASIAIQEIQSIEARLNELEKDNIELRCRLATYEDAKKRCGAEKQQVIDHKKKDVTRLLSLEPDFNTDQKINKAYDDGYDQGYLQCKMDQEVNKMEKAYATLGTRISDLLDQQGLSQRELADKVGVTEVSMYRYIKGERTPKGPIIANIAKVLHTTPDFLLGFETEEADINDAAGD